MVGKLALLFVGLGFITVGSIAAGLYVHDHNEPDRVLIMKVSLASYVIGILLVLIGAYQ